MERVALLIDQIGDGKNVFEQFAKEIERYNLQGISDPEMNLIQTILENIERRLQDLSEKITVENENEKNVYSLTISKTKEILSIWLPLFHLKSYNDNVSKYLISELKKLLQYVAIDNIKTKTYEEIKLDFEKNYVINSEEIRTIRDRCIPLHIHSLPDRQIENLTLGIFNSALNIIINKEIAERISYYPHNYLKPLEIEDSEDTIYLGQIKLWINTTEAGEANRFMNIITSVLTSIDNVELTITDSGIGSLWQQLAIKVKGWFAKEEVKQILSKTQKGLEAYVIDKHVEPIEKSKLERQKITEEIKRLMPEEKVKELQDIEIDRQKLELETIRLNNLEKKIVIMDKLSSILQQGLTTIDSDYRIELDGILLLAQEGGVISVGNGLDKTLQKKVSPSKKEVDNSLSDE